MTATAALMATTDRPATDPTTAASTTSQTSRPRTSARSRSGTATRMLSKALRDGTAVISSVDIEAVRARCAREMSGSGRANWPLRVPLLPAGHERKLHGEATQGLGWPNALAHDATEHRTGDRTRLDPGDRPGVHSRVDVLDDGDTG